jgi:hypothetical protein
LTPRVKLNAYASRGQNSLLEDNFAPGGSKFASKGEVKNGPLIVFTLENLDGSKSSLSNRTVVQKYTCLNFAPS